MKKREIRKQHKEKATSRDDSLTRQGKGTGDIETKKRKSKRGDRRD
jgi:hypothetical protein